LPRQPNALPVFLARHPLVLDVEESDGDLMGDGVNIAARLEGVCEPGEICLSEDAYRQVKGRLDLAVTDLGQTQLKNIAEPIRVYSLRVGVSAQAKPAMPAGPPAPKKRSALMPLAALLVLIGGGAWWFLNANRPIAVASKAPAEAARVSIVVLPFANLSGDPAQDYLADALTGELTSSRSHPRQLRERTQYRACLQGKAGRRQGDRQGLGTPSAPIRGQPIRLHRQSAPARR
jgi:adenylate cyclase